MIQAVSRGMILAVCFMLCAAFAQAQQYAALVDGRADRQGDPGGQRRHPGASRVADQDDDALHRLRRDPARAAVARPEGHRLEERRSEPPSRLGLRAGQKIEVRYLIRAAAIKSANDAATALGEAVAGSEEAFAARMNAVCPRDGLEEHHVQERPRPDPRGAHVDGARHGGARAAARLRLPAVLQHLRPQPRPRPASPPCATPTGGCSRPIRAPTASRPATRGPRASTSSRRRSAATGG